MSKKRIIIFIFTILSLRGAAQENEIKFLETEIALKGLFTSMYNSENGRVADSLNTIILNEFSSALRTTGSFNYSWSGLNMIGVLHSKDRKLNIYTWYLRQEKGDYLYFGFIQYNEGSRKKPDIKVYSLTDKSKAMKNPETLSLSPGNWLGCVYFGMVEYTFRGDGYYALLGYDFNNGFSSKKIVEVLNFPGDKEPLFEGDFQMEFQKVKRVIFEYSSQLVSSIRYDDKLRMIVFDHLAPFEEMFTGNYRFYGPDGSFDAFKFHKGSFLLQKDVDARNE